LLPGGIAARNRTEDESYGCGGDAAWFCPEAEGPLRFHPTAADPHAQLCPFLFARRVFRGARRDSGALRIQLVNLPCRGEDGAGFGRLKELVRFLRRTALKSAHR